MIEKSTYFYSDEESLGLCSMGSIVQLVRSHLCGIHLFLGAKMCVVFLRFIMKCKYRIANSY